MDAKEPKATVGITHNRLRSTLRSIRIMVIGFDYRVHGIDSGSMHEEQKTGPSYRPAHAVLA